MNVRAQILGSTRVSRVGDGVPAIANFPGVMPDRKDRFGETPKPTRETRVLPGEL